MVMQRKKHIRVQSLVFLLILIFAGSCVSTKKLIYFNDIDQLQDPIVNPREQKLIMPFDKLYIKVFSIDEKTYQLFNSNDNQGSSSTTSVIGYLVNGSGKINFPFVGEVLVSGLTTTQAGLKLSDALNEYVSKATVIIKFIDNNVTIMGEVQNQGTFLFSQEKLTIYEALALGGGISQFGDRKNVILIRQEGDRIMHHKLDLTNSGIAGKDYYYIQANDVIVVEPLKSYSWYNFNNGTYNTLLTSVTTLMALFIVFFRP
jgi:polysaccharide export outer membrane protein